MVAAALKPSLVRPAHPNELDRKRIERALQSRKRYRYVEPTVLPVDEGYQVRSPCCSRNIDKDGGVIDVALLRHDPAKTIWKLFRRDHAQGIWELHSVHQRLTAAVDELNADPERIFWQ
ncbi:DUF3024 domain-containing protein [Bradyrhizobium sp. HKCCYLS2038]|uniref:DUF3024 domain-containing protein n=1 Tax=unclassified Bradyrhizobium TaxID=2631580 RepID=UPI003EBEBFD4